MKSICLVFIAYLFIHDSFGQCYPVFVKMDDQPVSGALSNEVFRSPRAFYCTVSAYDGRIFDIWDGSQWSVLALPIDIKFSKGSNVSITKFKNTIIGSGPIKSFNNMMAPAGKFFKYIQYKNGVWDTLPGGMVDSAKYYYTSRAFATDHNLYHSETDLTGTYRGFINKYDTVTRKFVKILSYNEGLYGAQIICGANRVLIGNVTRIDLSIPKGFCYIDGDSVKLNTDARFDNEMIYGLDMGNDHIFAFERKNDPLVLEFDNQFISSRKTRLEYEIGNGDVQAFNGKLVWAANEKYVLCSGETDWKKISSEVLNVNVTGSGIYAKEKNSRNTMSLTTGSRISGYAYFDLDSNCNRDSLSEPILKGKIISAKSERFQSSCITDDSGRYEFYVYPDSFEIKGPGPLSSCFPKKTILMASAVDYNLDIPVLKPGFYDLRVKILNGAAIRWNSTTNYSILVENMGLPFDSAHFVFKLDSKLKLLAGDSTVTYFDDSTGSGQLKNLGYFDKRLVNFSVWADSGKAKVNSTVCSNFAAYLYTGERDSSNNSGNICQKVVYSLDPNHKDCNKDRIPASVNAKLEYYIGFQNEGNDYAQDVVVIDTLPESVLPETIEIFGASHPYTMTLDGRVLRFTFKNIYLQPKITNEALSQGFFKFGINTRIDLENGTVIPNKAFIYFDLNQPVITNTSIVNVGDLNADVQAIESDLGSLLVYPNPARTYLYIETSSKDPLQVYAINGQLLFSGEAQDGMLEINMATWPDGLYILRCGAMHRKVIKAE